jgi:hypothetical protein
MRITTTTWVPGPVLLGFITNMVLPYLYAWSAMWTFNSREGICLPQIVHTHHPFIKITCVCLSEAILNSAFNLSLRQKWEPAQSAGERLFNLGISVALQLRKPLRISQIIWELGLT